MPRKELWSLSTTMRNPNRTFEFLTVAKELEGVIWNADAQNEFQILLIKHRFYCPTHSGLDDNQILILQDGNYAMTEEEAAGIFLAKNYVDSPMRGRTSFNPLTKIGLAKLDEENRIKITEFGNMFLRQQITIEDVVLSSFLKLQLSDITGAVGFNSKPFINTLRIIKKVNEVCEERGIASRGISKKEFGIFCLSLDDYRRVDEVVQRIFDFREQLSGLSSHRDKQRFISSYISEYLCDFNNPEKNVDEYSDELIRCLRLTKYISVRGADYRVDIEHRREIEINAILENDNGSALVCSKEEYFEYLADINAYVLPFETIDSLKNIANEIVNEIHSYENQLVIPLGIYPLGESIDSLKENIVALRDKRSELQNKMIRQQYRTYSDIDCIVERLRNIRNQDIKPSIALEKYINIALNIFDDAIRIKSNAHFDDENEIIYTAPAGVADIECLYVGFNAICEVTMLNNQTQWFNEGQAVMDHLRKFEDLHQSNESFCLFIAPKIHDRTYGTFWNAVKYEYDGIPQKIVPLTITQIISLLELYKQCIGMQFRIRHTDIKSLFDSCTDVSEISSFSEWKEQVNRRFENWKSEIINEASEYASMAHPIAAEPRNN